MSRSGGSRSVNPMGVTRGSRGVAESLLEGDFDRLRRGFYSLNVSSDCCVGVGGGGTCSILASLGSVVLGGRASCMDSSRFCRGSFVEGCRFSRRKKGGCVAAIDGVISGKLTRTKLFRLSCIFGDRSRSERRGRCLAQGVIFRTSSGVFPPRGVCMLVKRGNIKGAAFLGKVTRGCSKVGRSMGRVVCVSAGNLSTSMGRAKSVSIFSSSTLGGLLDSVSESGGFSGGLVGDLKGVTRGMGFCKLSFVPEVSFCLRGGGSGRFHG